MKRIVLYLKKENPSIEIDNKSETKIDVKELVSEE